MVKQIDTQAMSSRIFTFDWLNYRSSSLSNTIPNQNGCNACLHHKLNVMITTNTSAKAQKLGHKSLTWFSEFIHILNCFAVSIDFDRLFCLYNLINYRNSKISLYYWKVIPIREICGVIDGGFTWIQMIFVVIEIDTQAWVIV